MVWVLKTKQLNIQQQKYIADWAIASGRVKYSKPAGSINSLSAIHTPAFDLDSTLTVLLLSYLFLNTRIEYFGLFGELGQIIQGPANS